MRIGGKTRLGAKRTVNPLVTAAQEAAAQSHLQGWLLSPASQVLRLGLRKGTCVADSMSVSPQIHLLKPGWTPRVAVSGDGAAEKVMRPLG